jgi:uncharacterized iron-regulated protein
MPRLSRKTPLGEPRSFSPASAAAGTALLLASATACGSAATSSGPVAPRPEREPLPENIVAESALPLHALVDGGQKLAEPELWERLASSRVICFGEQHDSPEHHFAQRRALEELATRSAAAQRPLSVGFEMFQRPFQPALTGFVAGTLPEEQFLIDSEYRERWGFDFALYRPLLLAAREFSLEALALNAPKELTRKIGRGGLAALDASEAKQLPELDLGNAAHKAFFEAAIGDHPMPAGGPSIENMYAAQVVWDETMADTAASWLAKSGETSQLIVFAGAGHCHESAVPARISRRVNLPVLSVTPVLRSQLTEFQDRQSYDWLIVLED